MEPAASRRCLRLAALALLLLVANCQDVPELSPGLRKDREGLLALKSKMTSFGNSQVASWRASGNPCLPTPWPSVKCSSGDDPRVTEIDLSNRGVAGTLSVGLRKAGRLEVINLQGNKFTDGLPNDWAKGNTFTRLRVINLANNELRQDLQAVAWNRKGAFRSLEVLDLSGNMFYGGLPRNWLGKYRPLRNVEYLDLSNNKLGESVSGGELTRDQWCTSEETTPVLKDGSGWCPTATVGTAPNEKPVLLEGTAASLRTLNLANNGLAGKVPELWPKMFPKLVYLRLQDNNLYMLDGTNKAPSALPESWTSDRQKGFLSLSELTLYPGNNYLCSILDDDGAFQDINLDATYQVLDVNGVAYGDGEPRLCPTAIDEDIQPTGLGFNADRTTATWTYAVAVPNYIWGFKVTIEIRDKDSKVFAPVKNGNGVLLRAYEKASDGGTKPAYLTESTGVWTFAFTSNLMPADIRIAALTAANYPDTDYLRLSVAIIGIDGVENTAEVKGNDVDDLINVKS